MAITDFETIAKVLNQSLINAHDEGIIESDDGDLKMSDLYPFTASEVVKMYTHASGIGDGCYFELSDGRVFSSLGVEIDTEKTVFDSVAN